MPRSTRERLDQLLFGRRQHAVEADHQKVADEMGVDVLGATAHIILLKAADPFADSRFDLALRLHAGLGLKRCLPGVAMRWPGSAERGPAH